MTVTNTTHANHHVAAASVTVTRRRGIARVFLRSPVRSVARGGRRELARGRQLRDASYTRP
jgi:hypothetical protein